MALDLICLVSIGTGSVSKGYDFSKAKDWGAIGWIKPIIEIMMSGNSKTVHNHLKQIFGSWIQVINATSGLNNN